MNSRWAAWLTWGVCGLLITGTLIMLGADLLDRDPASSSLQFLADLALVVPIIGFPILTALILTRQPRNVIGWLLLLPTVALATGALSVRYFARYPEAPPSPTLLQYLFIWFDGWSQQLLLAFPLLLIPLYFPDGRLPGRRWRWVAGAIAVEAAVFFIGATISTHLPPAASEDITWSVSNPIGFLPTPLFESLIGPWLAGVGILLLLCVASLIVRYRRAGALVRTQIRWLLYACGLLVLVFVTGIFLPVETSSGEPTTVGRLWNLAFVISIMAIPAAIAVAVLRYRLWDIDLIIRRTLVYSALTVILAMVYLGTVAVLQGLFTAVSGQSSAIIVVISTLSIAALFNPVRRRVQQFIDQRFYRRKYDAARTLAEFGNTLRDETDMAALTSRLGQVVADTMQPTSVNLWLWPTAKAAPSREPFK